MKEVTYKDWVKNPTPRMMWVWDSVGEKPKKQFVVGIQPKCCRPVIILYVLNSGNTITYKHCAEIEEPKYRRITNQELAWWLKGNPTREWKYVISDSIKGFFIYSENEGITPVDNDILIRENGGEWREPLVEVE